MVSEINEKRLWIGLITIALGFGLYFRFTGISIWPLASDEYYVYRAISFVLEHGLPRFPCDGFYPRGLLYQYATAPLIAAGLAPEPALRVVAGIAGLGALPAAYLIARRLGGWRVAAGTLIILSLSTWEIEMARFGRMYAPFQTLFLWYCYHALALVQSGDMRRWKWLIILAAAAPFVWEGGILIPVMNIVILFWNRQYWRTTHLAISIVTFIAAVAFLSTPFRFMGSPPPQDSIQASVEPSGGFLAHRLEDFPILILDLFDSPAAIVLLVLFAAVLLSLLVRARRDNVLWVAVLCSVAIGLSVLLGQLILAAIILTGALLVRWIDEYAFRSSSFRMFYIFTGLIAGAWLLLSTYSALQNGSATPFRTIFAFPNVIDKIVFPWLYTMPAISLALAFGCAALIFFSLRNKDNSEGARFIVALLLVAVLIIGAARTTYIETRYSFHLYPIALIIALTGINELFRSLSFLRNWPKVFAPAVCVLLFFFSMDFAFSHMSKIASYDANFRVGYEKRIERHYYPRFDFRSPAEYVSQHRSSGDIIISSEVPIAHYLPAVDYIYLDRTSRPYNGQACQAGKTERWTGLSLLASVPEIGDIVRSGPANHVWLIVDWQTLDDMLPREIIVNEWGLSLVYESPDNRIFVYR